MSRRFFGAAAGLALASSVVFAGAASASVAESGPEDIITYEECVAGGGGLWAPIDGYFRCLGGDVLGLVPVSDAPAVTKPECEAGGGTQQSRGFPPFSVWYCAGGVYDDYYIYW